MKQRPITDTTCYHRKGACTGFFYRDQKGVKVADEKIVKRLNDLAIPPAYDNVRYAINPNNYLQAIATDAKGRLQYFYHPKWREFKEQEKFDHLHAVGKRLPQLRRQVTSILDKKINSISDVDLDYACAIAADILDKTYMRIGSAEYATDNNSYGLSTLRRKHVLVGNDNISFTFSGKSGVLQQYQLCGISYASVLRLMANQPGYEVLCYSNADKNICDLTSSHINSFIKSNSSGEITAKDFRTWHAGVQAVRYYNQLSSFEDFKLTDLYDYAAAKLGNTASVTRDHYIHPQIVEYLKTGKKLPTARKSKWLSKEEVIVKKLII